MAATSDYLTQLQEDLETMQTAFGLESTDNFHDIALKAESGEIGGGDDISDYFLASTIGGRTAEVLVKKIPEITLSLNNKSFSGFFSGLSNIQEIGKITFVITSHPYDQVMMANFFASTKIKKCPPIVFPTNKVAIINGFFSNCTSLVDATELASVNITTAITSISRSIASLYSNCTSLTTVPLLDTSTNDDFTEMHNNNRVLTTVPAYDLSKATKTNNMFNQCTSLTTVPQFSIPLVTSLQNMFNNCTSLSDDSLNNIMAMCISATSYTGTKTLAYLGLTSTQATVCQGLSNYEAFTEAGWTTGF